MERPGRSCDVIGHSFGRGLESPRTRMTGSNTRDPCLTSRHMQLMRGQVDGDSKVRPNYIRLHHQIDQAFPFFIEKLHGLGTRLSFVHVVN